MAEIPETSKSERPETEYYNQFRQLSDNQLNSFIRTQGKVTSIEDDIDEGTCQQFERRILGHRHGQGGGHGHGHGEKGPSIVSAFISAVINFALMFGLCCAYGNIMFQQPEHAELVGLGVKMNLCSGMIMGTLLSAVSGVNVAIGGPDLNPVMFIAEFIKGIDKGLGGPLSPESVEFPEYFDKLRATTIFATALSSLIFAAIFFVLGKYGLTKYITFMPAAVVEAFLSCVGYKVFKYALKFCKYDPMQFMPASVVGVSLYFMKAYHVGNPAVVIPGMLGFPLIIYYICVFGSGSDLEAMRKEKWMFPKMVDAPFYDIWSQSIGKADMIDISAWTNTIPDLIIMIVVILLDCMLKIAATEEKLPVRPLNKDYEIKLYGFGNIFIAACGSSVGYMQLKFNVINFGILGNLTDKRGGFMYAFLCGVFFFVPGAIELFNYLPRLFLSLMLFFAGTGFVVENLWGSRKVLTITEWLVVLTILIVFILMGSLLIAVIVGCTITAFMFIQTYAGIPCVVYDSNGDKLMSNKRNAGLLERKLKNVLGHWVLIIRLKGFIFFGSASGVAKLVMSRLEAEVEHGTPAYARLHYIIFECQLLDGMDASGAKAMRKLTNAVEKHGGKVLWSGATDKFAANLVSRGVCDDKSSTFESLDYALHVIEDHALTRGIQIQRAWHQLHPQLTQIHEVFRRQHEFEPFSNVLMDGASRHGVVWKYCKRMTFYPGKVLWRKGAVHPKLYLIHSGAVAYYNKVPADDKDEAWKAPSAIFKNACFINREFLTHGPSREFAICMTGGEAVVWDEVDWAVMKHQHPVMAQSITHAVMTAQAHDLLRFEEMVARLDQSGPESKNDEDAQDMDESMESKANMLYSKHKPGNLLVSKKLRHLVIAQVLAEWGLFEDPGNDSFLPDLPDPWKSDLQCAFKAYSVGGQILKDDIRNALMYAGIFAIDVAQSDKDLSEDEFTDLAHKAVMAKLSKLKLPKLKEIFKDHLPPGKDAMRKPEFLTLFFDTFKQHLTGEEADRLIDGWDANRSGEIDEDEFLGLLSRLVKMHLCDWLLYKAIQDINGETIVGDELHRLRINVDQIKAAMKKRSLDFGDISAEEMVWVTDSVVREPHEPLPTELHAGDLLAELHLYHCPDRGQSALPPCGDEIGKTRLQNKSKEVSVKSGDVDVTVPKDQGTAGTISIDEGTGEDIVQVPNTSAAKLYLILEIPSSSNVALAWASFVLFLIAWVIVALLLEAFNVCHGIWFEVMMTTIFVVEFILRFAVCDALGTTTKKKFLLSPMNICDCLACLPLFIDVIFASSNAKNLRLLRMVRIIRLSRISRMGRYSEQSTLVGPIMMVLTIVYGIYYKEGPESECA